MKTAEELNSSRMVLIGKIAFLLVGDHSLIGSQQDMFAWCDGFDDAKALRDWFTKTHGLPFTGELIYWRDV